MFAHPVEHLQNKFLTIQGFTVYMYLSVKLSFLPVKCKLEK